MKQITTILLIFIVFSVFTYSQKTKPIDYSQKIKEATPKSLPQTPVAKRQTTDAQDDNLKGKVKSVIEEREGLTGIEKPIGKRTASFADYDEQGNYLRRVYFEYRGRPYSVMVYGYIDNARVSISKDVLFGDEGLIAVSGNKPKTQLKKKPDKRYEYKYEYKYVSGKLSEMQMISNTGEIYSREVYNYKGNQKETAIYTNKNELNQKYLYTFDTNGNDIKRIDFNVRETTPSVDGKFHYKYEAYDKEGNWTQRTFSKIEIENGNEVSKPLAVEYRAITYYP